MFAKILKEINEINNIVLQNKMFFHLVVLTNSQTVEAYKEIVSDFATAGGNWIQFDEPSLVTELSSEDREIFKIIYSLLLNKKSGINILLQTYFGDVRDIYQEIIKLDFDAIGLDFIEGYKNLELIKKYGFPKSSPA